MVDDYYEKIVQFLVMGTTPEELTTSQKKQLVVKIVDVIVTSQCIHLYFLCIITRCLFWDVL